MKPSKKRSTLTILISLFIALLCCLFLSVAFLPRLISSSFGKEKLISLINQSIPGKVDLKDISLSWLGTQNISDLSLLDPDNFPVLTIENIKINASLLKLLTNSLTFGEIEFNNLNTKIIGDAHGNTNFMRALDKNCCDIKQNIDAPISISLSNTQGHVNVSSENGPIYLQLSGETEQNSLKGKFAITAELERDSLASVNGDLPHFLENLKINADIVNFPVELLDQINTLRFPKFAGLLNEIFGNSLNIQINQNNVPNGIGFNIKANSPTLEASAEVLLAKELTLANPAKINVKISPQAFEKILDTTNYVFPWHLITPITANIILTNLTVPGSVIQSGSLDINAIGLEGSLDLGQASFQGEIPEKNLSLRELHATIASEVNSPIANIHLDSKALQNNQPAKINLNLKLPKSLLIGNLSSLSLKEITLAGNLAGIPLFAFDKLTLLPITSIIGPIGDVMISLQEKNNKLLANMQIKSEYLEIPQLSLWIDHHLTLEKPMQLILKLNETFANALLNGSQLQGPATAQLIVNSFSLPISEVFNFVNVIQKTGFDAQLKITTLHIANVPKIGDLSINDFTTRVTANSKTKPEIITSFSLQPIGTSNLAAFLGKKASFKTTGTLNIGFNGKIGGPIFNIEMISDLASLELSGEMHATGIVLNAQSKLNYIMTTAGLQLMGIAADDFIFQHGSPFEMTIDSSHIPTSFDDLSLLQLNGKLKINDFHLIQNSNSKAHAIVDNLIADWSINGEEKLISVTFKGITQLGENQAAGKISGALDITNWFQYDAFHLEGAKIKLNATASKLPTELLNALSSQKNLVPILGNAIDLSINANTSVAQTEKGVLSIDIHTENLSGGLALDLGEVIKLNRNRPAQFTLKLTPHGYAALRHNMNSVSANDFVLVEPTTATFKLHSMQIPRSQYLQSSLEGDFSIEKLIGMETISKNKISLNSIKGHLSSNKLSEKIDFNMSARGQAEQNNGSSWDISGIIANGFLQNGTFNKESASLSLDGTITSVPIPLLCQFACLNENLKRQIEIVLGPKIDAKVKAQLQMMHGPVYVDVSGENGRLTINGMLNQGILTLNEDLKAELTVTPQLGEYVLKDTIPVLSGLLSADHPINLNISKDGFAAPIKNPSLTNISIGRAVLNLGKVHFSGESQIAKVLDLLTPTTSTQLVWLTPAYFSLNQGILKLERVDMLISDRYPIAAWGEADIAKDRVNMIIALAGSAISKAFNVPKIANSHLLQLPLKGRLSNPSIDKPRAIARISALVAQSQGGTEGLVLGTVLDIASGGLMENAVPPITTNPLPWAAMMEDTQPADVNQKQQSEGKRTSPNPMDAIEKGASSLLKKIFR
jgi:hypothetical protein